MRGMTVSLFHCVKQIGQSIFITEMAMQKRKERRGSQLSKTVQLNAKAVVGCNIPKNINNYVHLLGKGGSG